MTADFILFFFEETICTVVYNEATWFDRLYEKEEP